VTVGAAEPASGLTTSGAWVSIHGALRSRTGAASELQELTAPAPIRLTH
jgi:hypothetical protein